jgi:hypothetical protein
MSINIDCVDWHTADDEAMTILQQRLPNPILVNSVGQMVNLIEGRLRPNGRMRRLRIFGHGIAGVQGLGNSHNLYDTNLYNQISLGIGSEVLYANMLGRLRDKFAAGGWAELMGCSVGGGANGWNLLKALAKLWQVNVAAGTVEQNVDAGFEVQYRVAEPNGAVHTRHGHTVRAGNNEQIRIALVNHFLMIINPLWGTGFLLGSIAHR